MSTGDSTTPFILQSRFADAFPELAAPWHGEEAPEPSLVILNEPLARLLGMDPEWLRNPEGMLFLLGLNEQPVSRIVAQGYAGHQFGQFVPSLGDGRAILLGEAESTDGVLRDVHLKGSGRTPFSRGADGRGALGPILREYIISESLHALGVPTTRSLAVLTTGRRIQRGSVVPGAVLVRVATSHIRIGSFQYANIAGGIDLSARLADHAIERHFPDLAVGGPAQQLYTGMFDAVLSRLAGLAAKWMRLGFVHGVLNTDNTLISGETIDYGPCAFMERYREDAVYSSIDNQGRYAYGNQPSILGWNLARLAETIFPLFGDTPDEGLTRARELMASFGQRYRDAWYAEMATSLGIGAGEHEIIDEFHQLLIAHSPDLTTLNRALTEGGRLPAGFEDWRARWDRLSPDRVAMAGINPIYIPRNHLVEEALTDAVAGDLERFHVLLDAVTSPFERRAGLERLEAPSPDGFEENYMTFCGT
ncbi:protein adenylyltransferase SelO [Corynebacterium pacaense]|uniref:protein adenylyltransferase SelO n=1 Tax=Corynebacterium pacaense TaxID=1816684 RepID=UPI0009BB4496|nr:YdiU family protein [Corynebacterium pacaense]